MAITPRSYTLPQAAPERLEAAISAVLDRTTGSSAPRLGAAAAQGFAAQPSEPEVARTFQALLAAAFLVASADGLVDQERSALAALLARATGGVADHGALERRLTEIATTVAAIGPEEAMRHAAADLAGPFARREAIVFAAAVAIADGTISETEFEALARLGAAVNVSRGEVVALVEDAIQSITRALAG